MAHKSRFRIFARDLVDPVAAVWRFCILHSFAGVESCARDIMRGLAPEVDRLRRQHAAGGTVVDDNPPPIPAGLFSVKSRPGRPAWLTRDVATRLHSGLCLEIGPLVSPLLPPSHPNAKFMDYATREEIVHLKQRDPNVNTSLHRVPTIQYIWRPGEPYASLVGDARFELVIASHVVEHVPNLVDFSGKQPVCCRQAQACYVLQYRTTATALTSAAGTALLQKLSQRISSSGLSRRHRPYMRTGCFMGGTSTTIQETTGRAPRLVPLITTGTRQR